MQRALRILTAALYILTACAWAAAEDHEWVYGFNVTGGRPAAPAVDHARYVAAVDAATGRLLYALGGREPWPPASLTKLVSIYAALEAAEDGRFSLTDAAPVHEAAFASAVPAGSSLMFLGPGQNVHGEDLLRGLAISSGNDAAVEVALRVSGSVGRFARRMNTISHELGYDAFYFEEPAGLSPANRVTAEGIARFSLDLLMRWPWVTTRLFGIREFAYPEARHMVPETRTAGTIVQPNRNGLVGSYPGADGLKTGYIESAGYNIVATASRNGRRVVVAVLGVEAAGHTEGGRLRELDAAAVMDWAFASYEPVAFARPHPEALTVWGGERRTIRPTAVRGGPELLPAGLRARVSGRMEQSRHIWAPVEPGTRVGSVYYEVDGESIAEYPITIERSVESAGLLRRVIDRIRWWWRQRMADRATRRPAPVGR